MQSRSDITLVELARSVAANIDMLRTIEQSTRRRHERAAVRQIIDAYEMYASARRFEETTGD